MRTLLRVALGVCLASLAVHAQPTPEAQGRYVRVRTTVWIPPTTARVDGKHVVVPGRNSSIEQWVWVPKGQPLPPNAILERSNTDITIPDIVIP